MADNPNGGYGFADDPEPPPRLKPARRVERVEDPQPKPAKPRTPREFAEVLRAKVTAPPAKMKKWEAVALTLLLTLAVAGVVAGAIWQRNNASTETAAYAAEMNRLMAPPAAGPAKPLPGKVAILDMSTREPHYLHRCMKSDIRAWTPQEAVAIVQLRVADREVSEYLNGRKAVRRTFHLTVIDKATWTKIDEKVFDSGDPPESIRLKGGDRSPVAGPLPSDEMYAYLRGLFGT